MKFSTHRAGCHPVNNTLEARQQLLHDAENAWLEYKATGLHLTGDELSDWLDAIARGEDKAPPLNVICNLTIRDEFTGLKTPTYSVSQSRYD